jgi:hypothetical protein
MKRFLPLLALLSILSILSGCAHSTHRSIYAMTVADFYELLSVEQKQITDVLSSEDHELFMKGGATVSDSATILRMTVGEVIEAGRKVARIETAPSGKVPEATDR